MMLVPDVMPGRRLVVVNCSFTCAAETRPWQMLHSQSATYACATDQDRGKLYLGKADEWQRGEFAERAVQITHHIPTSDGQDAAHETSELKSSVHPSLHGLCLLKARPLPRRILPC